MLERIATCTQIYTHRGVYRENLLILAFKDTL